MLRSVKLQLLVVMAVAFMLPGTNSYSFHWGSCPKVDPVPNFDIKKLTGLWYVIEKFDVATPCWTYYFQPSNGTSGDNSTFDIIASRDQIVDDNSPGENASYTGSLKVPNSSKPGTMRTQFSDNVIGEHDLTFFDTDYENYAAFFTCQSVVVGHRRSASIISRTPLLASRLIAKARGKLMSFDIDLDRLKRIDQHPCSYLPTIMGTFISNSSFTQISDFNP